MVYSYVYIFIRTYKHHQNYPKRVSCILQQILQHSQPGKYNSHARRLTVPPGVSIGVFFSQTKKKSLFITDSMVATLLQHSASAVFNIKKSSPSLKLWSTHSIRVTAANLLHRAKFADSFIQTRLRWKSTTFLMYLRNTIYSAQAHTKALSISDSNLPPHAQRCYRHKEQVEQIFSRAAAAA